MASTSYIGGMAGPARKDTLADLLTQGPLALSDALGHAVQIAAALRELHATNRVHGRISPLTIALNPSGVKLLPGSMYFEAPERETDVRGWGAVLFEMVTGDKPPVDGSFEVPRPAAGRRGPTAIRPAALRLAMKCLVLPPHTLPTMQLVLSEVRVLALLARQYESGQESPAPPTSPPPPFLITAPAAVTAPVAIPPTNPRAAALARLSESAPIEGPEIPGDNPRAFALARLAESPDDPTGPGYDLASFGQPTPKEPAERAPRRAGPCPHCHASAIYMSKPRSSFENRLVHWGVPICRCHRCYHRWIFFAWFRIGKTMPIGDPPQKIVKRRGD